MYKNILSIFTLLIIALTANGNVISDSTHIDKKKSVVSEVPLNEYRSFDQLHIPNSPTTSDPILIPNLIFADSTQHYRSEALEYEQEVTSRGALIGNLNELSFLKLPVGLERQVGAMKYTIIISSLKMTPSGSSIEAYFLFEIPQTGDKIAFRGANISFSNDGGFSGVGRLDLIGSYAIKFNERTLLTIIGQSSAASGNSFVEFDCNGFRSMGLEAEVEFSRDLIIPEDENGKQKPKPERVKTKFTTVVQNWNDLLLGVSIPSFQVDGLNGVSFNIQNAFIDWSDLANPSGIQFPSGYSSTFIEAGQSSLWQGFYFQRLEVKLPASFSKKEGGGRITIGVENMILDDQGFTGKVFAENVLTAGDMNGWGYSIDRVGLELVVNQVKGFEIAGEISVPRIKKKSDDGAANFGYRAQRSSDGSYIFAVSIEDDLKLPVFAADITLYPGSAITVKERENKFYPSALLNGDITIKPAVKGVNPNFNQLRFEGLLISSEEPHFDINTIAFGGSAEQSVSKFPVVISDISIKKESNRIGIGFNLTINIGGKSSEEGFGGTAGLTIWSVNERKPVLGSEGQVVRTESEWKFDKIEMTGVGINIKKENAYELSGKIDFFESDPVYGNGFKGTLSGKISEFGGIQATALFGRTEDFRYWYADALVTIDGVGVPLVPGALFATGFGGGFYSKMKQTDKSPGSSFGRTQSGIYYIPDENTLGIKAIMNIGTAKPQAMNGNVGLEVMMNKHGGINTITLTGNANFMSLAKVGESQMQELAVSAAGGKLSEKLGGLMKGQVFGSMKLVFDNVNDVFHGNLDIFINVAGGLIKGIGQNSRAGWAVLHFEKTDWYVLIGTPDDPLGLEVAKIFKSRSYFMLGKNLPGSPPPPSQVTEILGGNIDLDYMRDLNALQSATGFAFGLSFIVDTGDVGFLMFYGHFSAGTGVDFMLKDYGKNCVCEGSSGTIGIDGWFANGQAYAFVQGKIGIKVNMRFVKGKFDILSIGAAAIMQAKGPNPFWMKGIVGGYYDILGGLVKGDCRFEVTIGKDCKIVKSDEETNPLEDVEIIADISPAQSDKEVDVFTAPQVAFNMPIGKIFGIPDEINGRRLFRGNLTYLKLISGGREIKGNIRWNETSDVAVFDAFDILPPQKDIRVLVKVVFEEYNNEQWNTITFEGKPIEEAKEITFATGVAPDYIPPSNIDISYPAVGQFNFYPKEYNQAFIELKKGQPYLFKGQSGWSQKIHFTKDGSDAYLETDLSYNDSERRIHFSVPQGLENARAYRLEVKNLPQKNNALDANVRNMQTSVASEAGDLLITTKALEGNLELKEAKTLYESLFRTSSFNTFTEKVSAVRLSNTYRENVGTNVFQLMAYIQGNELFDKAEIGGNFLDREIQFEAVLNPNNWYQQYVYPLVYEEYPLSGFMSIRNRDTHILGVPPARSLFIDQGNYYPVLTGENIGATFTTPYSYNNIRYDLMVPALQDYRDLQNQVANHTVGGGSDISQKARTLLLSQFPVYRYGSYKVKIKYVIPRINKTTSTYEWELFNEVD